VRGQEQPPRSIVVVGGGITGLVAAQHLADAGARVTLLEGDATVGGQVRTRQLAGHQVDVGAEALHTATPAVGALLRRTHLEDELVGARRATTWVVAPRGLRRLPAGMGPAGPTKLWPVATSRILSPAGLLRAAMEPLVPASHDGDDVSVGTYLSGRFGAELTERLVDPLLGNLHAGDVHRLSLAAATPQLDRAARRHRSLVLGRRRAGASGPPPRFVSLVGGLGRLTAALAADPRIAVRTSAPVERIEPHRGGYCLLTSSGPVAEAEAVVLAVPATAAAWLLAPLDAEASRVLAGVRTATVATVIVAFRSGDVAGLAACGGSGVLVPSSSGRLLKAATFLTSKWPHHASDEHVLVRLSTGRAGERAVESLDDDILVERLLADLADLTGLASAPVARLVQRWPQTMPQLEVGHGGRIADTRRRLHARHRIVLAGASYDGVGISSCLGSAASAVQVLLDGDARPREVAA
jgi:protoporphyrinogen/coproporphyrinogen III oxidase